MVHQLHATMKMSKRYNHIRISVHDFSLLYMLNHHYYNNHHYGTNIYSKKLKFNCKRFTNKYSKKVINPTTGSDNESDHYFIHSFVFYVFC